LRMKHGMLSPCRGQERVAKDEIQESTDLALHSVVSRGIYKAVGKMKRVLKILPMGHSWFGLVPFHDAISRRFAFRTGLPGIILRDLVCQPVPASLAGGI